MEDDFPEIAEAMVKADAVTPEMLPSKFDEQRESIIKCRNAANLLNDI
ncbi:MAG: hypothetical protein N2B06_14255 [Clostridium sp.]